MNNPGLSPLLRLFAFYPLVLGAATTFPDLMIAIDRPGRAAVYTLVSSLGRLIAIVATVAVWDNLEVGVLAAVTMQAVVIPLGILDALRFLPPGPLRLTMLTTRKQLSYVFPWWASRVTWTMQTQLDRLIISFLYLPSVFAVYSCGAFQIPLFSLVTQSVFTAMMPNLVDLYDRGQQERVLWTWQEGTRKCSLVIFPVFFLLLPLSQDLMVLLYGEAYRQAAIPFVVNLFLLPLRVTIFSLLFRVTGRSKPILVSAVLGLVTQLIFSPALAYAGRDTWFGLAGPGIGSCLSNLVVTAYFLRCLSGDFSVSVGRIMRWGELLRLGVPCALCSLVLVVLPLQALPVPVRLGVQAGVYTLVLSGVLLQSKELTVDEVTLLKAPWSLLRRAQTDESRGGGKKE